MPGVQYTVGLDNSQFLQSANAATAASTSIGGSAAMAFAGIGGAVTTATAALGLLRSALTPIADLIKDSIGEASSREDMLVSFKPLLGSAAAAEARIAELSKFAAETPFGLPEVAKASKVLEALTEGALSTGKGLTLVGDIAANTGQPFSEVAVSVGRLYSALQNGTAAGESIARLTELAAITPKVRQKIEELQDAGVKGGEVWAVAAEGLNKTGGSMEALSQTFNGKTSSMKDEWASMLSGFGTPIIDSIKPYLDTLTALFAEFTPIFKGLGQTIGDWISKAAAATGNVIKGVINAVQILMKAYEGGTLGALAQQGLEIAFKTAVNVLWAGLNGCVSAVGQGLIEYVKTFINIFSMIAKADFWMGLGKVLLGIFVQIGAYLQEIAGKILREIPTLGDTGDAWVKEAQEGKRQGTNMMKSGGVDLMPLVKEFSAESQKSALAVSKAFWDTYDSTNPLLEVKPVIDSFTASIGKLDEVVKKEDEAKKKEKEKNKPDETKKALAPVAEIMEKLKTITFQMVGASSLAAVGGGGYGRMVTESKDISKQQLTEAKKANGLLQKIVARPQSQAVFA